MADAQAVSRERTPRRARAELEELTMRRRIKKDVVQEHSRMFPVLSIFSIKMLGVTSESLGLALFIYLYMRTYTYK